MLGSRAVDIEYMGAQALLLSDIHASPTLQDVAYGKDTPFSLLDETLAAAAEQLPNPSFLLILGDLVAHHARTQSAAAHTFRAVAASIHHSFPSLPKGGCAVAVGNNDVFPDYAVPSSLGRQGEFYQAQAEAVRDLCGLDADAFESLRIRGFYATQPSVGLQLAVLNTDIYSPLARVGLGLAEPSNASDPLGQFRWLEQRLAEAATTGGRVLILGHIPPMVDEYGRGDLWRAQFARHYWSLIRRHAREVAGQFFGHVHSDEFRVFSSSAASGDSVSTDAIDAAPPLMTLGSVSPIFGNNPAFYSMEVTRAAPRPDMGTSRAGGGGGGNASERAFRPKEIDVFYKQLGASPPVGYRRLYRATSAFRLASLSNRAYARLGMAFAARDGDAWETWFRNYKLRSDDPRILSHPTCDSATADAGFCANCTGGCRMAFACLLNEGISVADYRACLIARGLQPRPVVGELAAVASALAMMVLLVVFVAYWPRLLARAVLSRATTAPTTAPATEAESARTLDSVMPAPVAHEMQGASKARPLAASDGLITQTQAGGAYLG